MPRIWKRKPDRNNPLAPYYVTWTDWTGEGGAWAKRERSQRAFASGDESMALGHRLEEQALRRKLALPEFASERRTALRSRPLSEHVADYREHLESKSNSTKHVAETIAMIEDVASALNWTALSQLDAAGLTSHLNTRAKAGRSARTVNKRRGALRSFARWLCDQSRLDADPFRGVPTRRELSDRRRVRRALEEEEIRRVIDAAAKGPDWIERTRGGHVKVAITGHERAMLYRLDVATGLRAEELRSLSPRNFRLDGDRPCVIVEAAYSKRRKRDEQPIPSELAGQLRAFLAGKRENVRIWRMGLYTATMFQRDLAAARAAWIEEARTAGEREQRERSRFLCERDHAGQVADFHALRHTFITRLARANVPPKVAQTLARHSSITLTLDRYTHLGTDDQARALESLPSVESASPAQAVAAAANHAPPPVAPAEPAAPAPITLRLAGTQADAQRPRWSAAGAQRVGAAHHKDRQGPSVPSDRSEEDGVRRHNPMKTPGLDTPGRSPSLKGRGRIRTDEGFPQRICNPLH